ncbi:MAG: formylglycine-generating enzyme family protein, partial [Vicinamibacterales bacterium]
PLLGFVEIPAGPFLMGSDRSVDALAHDNERWPPTGQQALLDLPAFYIGKYEVTVAQFAAFTGSTGRIAPPAGSGSGLSHPATSVSWPDALAYSRWLEPRLIASPSTPERLRQLLADGWHLSLPSEAQWEKAARGTDGRIYPWGNEPQRSSANYLGQGTAAVGQFACAHCPFGLFDMSGNVWEWTRSPYQPYPYAEADDASDLEADALWVIRGGSFADAEGNIRTATRGGADPGVRRPFIGFRLVLTRF